MTTDASEQSGPVKVTVSDPETGKVFEEKIVHNDYVIITNGRRYVKSIQTMGKTHMLAVAWAKEELEYTPDVESVPGYATPPQKRS